MRRKKPLRSRMGQLDLATLSSNHLRCSLHEVATPEHKKQ
jgi:hypothetical protein